MLELDSALAQLIVDRAMAILPHNINVMDEQGMIIGTGDPQRLHTRHEGAQLVLANRRVVEIDGQAAACLRGVRPGVNLPLFHAERLIGVLGITGEPDLVRPYAELVRMAAEVLVEQRQLQVERHWQRHQLEAWLCQLADPRTELVPLAAEAERCARLRTSPATTAKPRPCSPARAASTAAFSARMLVWNAMPSITPMMSTIFFDASLISSMVCTTRPTTSPPRNAVSEALAARPLAWRALSAFWRTVLVSSSMLDAVCSSDAACCSVR